MPTATLSVRATAGVAVCSAAANDGPSDDRDGPAALDCGDER
jgi:hypothetical protein